MPFVPCANTAEVSMRYNLNGQTVENVYHVTNTAGWNAVSLAALCLTFKNWEVASGAPCRGNLCYLYDIYARDLTTQDGAELDYPVNPTVAGTVASQLKPNNVTIAVKAQTGLAGRSQRGRTYWIGLTDGQAPGNWISDAAGVAIVNALNALKTSVGAVGGNGLVVRSLRHNGAARAAGVMTPITSYVLVDNVVDSQRRRLPAHNRHH